MAFFPRPCHVRHGTAEGEKLNFETSSALFETFEADKKGNELTRKKARIKPSNCATAYDGDDRHLLLLSTCSLFLPELHLLSDGRRCFLGYCCLWTAVKFFPFCVTFNFTANLTAVQLHAQTNAHGHIIGYSTNVSQRWSRIISSIRPADYCALNEATKKKSEKIIFASDSNGPTGVRGTRTSPFKV